MIKLKKIKTQVLFIYYQPIYIDKKFFGIIYRYIYIKYHQHVIFYLSIVYSINYVLFKKNLYYDYIKKIIF